MSINFFWHFVFENSNEMNNIGFTRLSTIRVRTIGEKRLPRDGKSRTASSEHVHKMHFDNAEIGP